MCIGNCAEQEVKIPKIRYIILYNVEGRVTREVFYNTVEKDYFCRFLKAHNIRYLQTIEPIFEV